MNKKQKKMLARILISAALMIALHFLPVDGYIRFFLYLIPYLIIGYDILIKAFKGIKNRQPFDESLLMAIATIGAIAIAIYSEVVDHEAGDYVEAIAVMLFYQVGECPSIIRINVLTPRSHFLSDIMKVFPSLSICRYFRRVCPSFSAMRA